LGWRNANDEGGLVGGRRAAGRRWGDLLCAGSSVNSAARP
jgi:hypothetical protein